MARRSPNYPGVDLKFAVERAQRLWERQQHHPMHSSVVMENLGYTPKSGAGSVTFGALKRFGLLIDAGGRSALTDLGVEIVRAEDAGRRDYSLLRKAALNPSIHQEMFRKYGPVVPQGAKFDLVQEHGFTPGGAEEFLGQWKRTIDFARLTASPDTVSTNGSSDSDEDQDDLGHEPVDMTPAAVDPRPAAPSRGSASTRHYPFPLLDGEAALTVPSEMTEASWQQMMAVLAAIKPGIVRIGHDLPDD